jgi:hypothetical protein
LLRCVPRASSSLLTPQVTHSMGMDGPCEHVAVSHRVVRMNAGKLSRGVVILLWLGACGSTHESTTSGVAQPDAALPPPVLPESTADAAASAMSKKGPAPGDPPLGKPGSPSDSDGGAGSDAGGDKPRRLGPDGMPSADGPGAMPGMHPPHAGMMAPPPPPGMEPPRAGMMAPPPPPPAMEPPPQAGMKAPPPHAGDHA